MVNIAKVYWPREADPTCQFVLSEEPSLESAKKFVETKLAKNPSFPQEHLKFISIEVNCKRKKHYINPITKKGFSV